MSGCCCCLWPRQAGEGFRLFGFICLSVPRCLNRAGPAGARWGGMANHCPLSRVPSLRLRAFGPAQTRSRHGWPFRGRPARSPGPTTSLGNDLTPPSPLRAVGMCGESRGGFLFVRCYGRILLLPVASLGAEKGFGCSDSSFYPYTCASTEQGLPARRPCTRALLGGMANHCPLSRVPSLRLRACGPAQTRSRRGWPFRGRPARSPGPTTSLGNDLTPSPFLQMLGYVRKE